MAANKLASPAFYAEIQVIAIWAESRRREVGAELDKLVGFVVELAGGDTAWKPTARKEVAGKTLFRGRRDRSRLEPWPLAAFLSPRQASRYVLSPQEVPPLWPAPLSLPKPLAAEALATPQPDPEFSPNTLPDSTTNTLPPVPQRNPGNRHRSPERCRGRAQTATDTGHDPAGNPATNPLGHINPSQRTAL